MFCFFMEREDREKKREKPWPTEKSKRMFFVYRKKH